MKERSDDSHPLSESFPYLRKIENLPHQEVKIIDIASGKTVLLNEIETEKSNKNADEEIP